MAKRLISMLLSEINEGGDAKEKYEDSLIESIEKAVKEEKFFELPTKEIMKIIEKSDIEDILVLREIVSGMSKKKGEETPLLLNVLKANEASFSECISVI